MDRSKVSWIWSSKLLGQIKSRKRSHCSLGFGIAKRMLSGSTNRSWHPFVTLLHPQLFWRNSPHPTLHPESRSKQVVSVGSIPLDSYPPASKNGSVYTPQHGHVQIQIRSFLLIINIDVNIIHTHIYININQYLPLTHHRPMPILSHDSACRYWCCLATGRGRGALKVGPQVLGLWV